MNMLVRYTLDISMDIVFIDLMVALSAIIVVVMMLALARMLSAGQE